MRQEESEMDEAKLASIYTKIAQTVVETIPEEWDKVYLYGEIAEGVQKSYFYYYPKDVDKPVYSHNIPQLFNMDEEDYDKLWYQLLDYLQELWNEFKHNEKWTNLTFVFDSNGNFKVDYDYEDLSNADDYERRLIWKYKYLGLIPEDDDDKKFLEEYLNSIKENNE
jgi:uncharacterized protein (TIGR01741 family)